MVVLRLNTSLSVLITFPVGRVMAEYPTVTGLLYQVYPYCPVHFAKKSVMAAFLMNSGPATPSAEEWSFKLRSKAILMLSSRVSGFWDSWAPATPVERRIPKINPMNHLILIDLFPPFHLFGSF